MNCKPIDITGKKFNRLTALRYVGKDKNGACLWECRCDCGNLKVCTYGALNSGGVKSCGCLYRNRGMISEPLTGRRFGRLVVLRFAEYRKGVQYWTCRCDCGTIKDIKRSSLLDGKTVSCGCYNKEICGKAAGEANRKPIHTKYGDFTTRDWVVKEYLHMVERATSDRKIYKHYRDIGIGVSKDWYDPSRVKPGDGKFRDEEGIRNFIEDMYPSMLEHIELYGINNTTLDRKKGIEGYSKTNCRWATRIVQNNNLTTNRHISDDGIHVLTFAECARKYIDDTVKLRASETRSLAITIDSRVQYGWTANEILCALKHAKELGKIVHHRKLRQYFMIWNIDQSCVYDMYPNEKRLPGYEDYVPKPPTG